MRAERGKLPQETVKSTNTMWLPLTKQELREKIINCTFLGVGLSENETYSGAEKWKVWIVNWWSANLYNTFLVSVSWTWEVLHLVRMKKITYQCGSCFDCVTVVVKVYSVFISVPFLKPSLLHNRDCWRTLPTWKRWRRHRELVWLMDVLQAIFVMNSVLYNTSSQGTWEVEAVWFLFQR